MDTEEWSMTRKNVLRIIVSLFSLLISLLAMALPLSGCAGKSGDAKAEPLIVGMELAYPPFETKDANGGPSGVSPDFVREFAAYLGRDIQIENIAWAGLIPSLQTGKVDLVMSTMAIRADRAELVDFSDPYANSLLAVLTNKDSDIKTIDGLNQPGRKIAVKNGTSGYFYARDNLTEADLTILDDESACVVEVSQGKADGFIYDQLTIYRNWQSHLDTTSAIFIPFQDVAKWGIAVQKGNSELLGQINDFIKKFRDEGGFDRLTQKYLSDEKAAFDELGFQWFFDLK
jgi:polar amino acid transport system substrate-binding protein